MCCTHSANSHHCVKILPISLQFADIEDIGAALGGITNRLNSLLKKMNKLKTQSEEESTSLMNAITSINDTLTDRLNSQLRKMDAAKTQSEEESTSLRNAITSINDTLTDRLNTINDTLACLKEDVNNLTTGGAHNPAASCRHILELLPNSGSRFYWIRDSSGRVTQQYCDMEREGCGTRGGWMRVAHLDMTQPNQQCPSGFRLITSSSKRLCGRPGPGANCASVKFSTNGIAYNKVCGKVIAYQDKSPDGLYSYNYMSQRTIDAIYMDGVSITHGNPRQHIWSFVSSNHETSGPGSYYNPRIICPCFPGFQGRVPPFMGNNYFCESGTDIWVGENAFHLYPDNPLWDGEGCATSNSCCDYNNPPWFCTEFSTPTSNDIELRICGSEPIDNEDVPIEKFELYVQ